jgi:preprotein translocase subunit SecA
LSDVRALVAGRGVEIGDGAYLERSEAPVPALEEMLRGWSARFAFGSRRSRREFVTMAARQESALLARDDGSLRQALHRMAGPMHGHGFRDDLIASAFAVVREAARRTLGLRHHDVQLLAGRALLQGQIAEMATGEGKTLAATLAACTAAVTGAAVHVVTVNDYLAERDAGENLALYELLGLSVGLVKQGMPLAERRAQYARDVVYVSNKELAFDYLKDRIALGTTLHTHLKLRSLYRPGAAASALLRGLHLAIVDEVDSILIDEARTPLIISETLPDDLDPDVYAQGIALARSLEAGADYRIGPDRDIWLTAAGLEKIRSRSAGFGGPWQSILWQKELVQKALSALHAFQRDRHYIVAENKVQIVDEFTGRVMPDRTWERGLHQMIEAKEGCEITSQRKTLAQITYQRFFGRYLLLGGMTGTAREVAPELKRIYDLSVVRIPTHKPCRRVRLENRVFRTEGERWMEVARRAREVAAEGRAVLVGTRSVEASERLSRLLEEQGVEHTVLNARQDKSEAEAISRAGHPGCITVATNMAGRGTDIRLAPEVFAKGGLHVILTEFHESARVDRQLFGRAARQGDPGSVEAIVCLRDELFRRYVPALTGIAALWLRRPRWFRRLVLYAQSRAERHHRRVRLETVRRDRQWQRALAFVGSDKR